MRLFAALDLPWDVRQRVAGLAAGLPGARWVDPANYHLTLRFLGELANHRAEDMDQALAVLHGRPFTLELAGVGVFAKSGSPSKLWVGIGRNPALEHLQRKIETALQRAGLPPERRRFTPHVSVAGLDASVADARLAGWMQARNLFRSPPMAVDRFFLFSSQRGNAQSVYTPEREYPLG